MEISQKLNSLQTSLSNLANETDRIANFIQSRFSELIFFPSIIEADIDYTTYCKHCKAIKQYTDQLPLNADTAILKQKAIDLPAIDHRDFQYYHWGLPTILILVILPIGIVAWINTYIKLTDLQSKLKIIKESSDNLRNMIKILQD
ncbi:hypothetical protein KJS94_14375 [Flavihumibacter rivuli]|uniref:hypothetical protein n=1 Tax=Flavihumibacter rivuli TaxID=2838156 RepID=UPI001BDF3EC4|nr:hypothetical protein [Flavihumibacter rivuli]ULQ55832.1 hypothetical protein KJS94_14375 [Flavihumibacter rivuli]